MKYAFPYFWNMSYFFVIGGIEINPGPITPTPATYHEQGSESIFVELIDMYVHMY